jgi:hypothetical protein
MIPIVTEAAKHFPSLSGYRVFEVSESIIDFAHDLSVEAAIAAKEGEDAFVAPISSRLPADKVVFGGEGQTSRDLVLCEQEGEDINIYWLSPDMGYMKSLIGQYRPGGPMRRAGHLERTSLEINMATEWPFIVALINEPRMVRLSKSGSRPERRMAHRGFGFAVDAWHRVSWDISRETVAKISRDPKFHKVPLHWRRGHWRRAQEHYAGAVKRTDAFRFEDRLQWWQWIEGHWVGHPAFGLKKSYHAPRFSIGKGAA